MNLFSRRRPALADMPAPDPATRVNPADLFPHSVHKVDHTGRGVSEASFRTLEDAVAHGESRKAETVPSVLAGNSWYVASRQLPGMRYDITYIR